jgi:seryl-tRNA synthetase
VIDLRRLRDEPTYRERIVAKGASPHAIDDTLAAAEAHRRLQHDTEAARAAANAASRDIGRAEPDERPARIEAAQRLKAEVTELEHQLREAAERLQTLALALPNPAHPSVPVGGEDDFEVVAEVGARAEPALLDHAEFGERMGFVNTEPATEISGSRFAYVTGPAVQVQFALVQWALTRLVSAGFVPTVPPVLVREQMMVEAGFFPTDRQQVYEVAEDDLFLVGTSEVPLAGLHRGHHLEADTLPRRYVGYSTCFRREAGTYGKDTRGLFRVHQFDKVEMFSYAHPDDSWEELETLRALQEELVGALGLPYRVINVASGELGPAAAKKYDLEVWLPSEGRYREITSCSNYTDYSARRLGVRYRSEGASDLLHTLNGTACAIGRTLVFLFEHYQRPDGTFAVPEVLQRWCGFAAVTPEGVRLPA